MYGTISWNTLQSRPWWIPSMLLWREELVHWCIFSPTLIRPVVKRQVVFARNHHNDDYYYRYCYFYKYCDEVRWVMILCLHWKVMMSCLWWRHICRSCWRKVWREMWSESKFAIYVLHTPMWCKLESPPCLHRVHIGTNPFPSFSKTSWITCTWNVGNSSLCGNNDFHDLREREEFTKLVT